LLTATHPISIFGEQNKQHISDHMTMTMDNIKSSASASVVTMLPEPVKGKSDWRDFRCIQLPNGVKVCLVHDKSSKTTAAAACVEAGAGADPRNFPGIAHFCEHSK
jgi:secreted Zn-dependent insulinase-like peptidase